MSTDEISFDIPPDEFRVLGTQIVEMMLEAVQAEQSGPVLRQISGQHLRRLLEEPLPEQEGDAADPDNLVLQQISKCKQSRCLFWSNSLPVDRKAQ